MRRKQLSTTQLALALLIGSVLSLQAACSHVTVVRLQPDAVAVQENLRPIAAVQANAISYYLLFVPIPGVDLDKVINQMLIATAKTIGADKIANLRFDIDPAGGIWALRKIGFYRSAQASGIAVQVTAPMDDPDAMQGPEPADVGGAPTSTPSVPGPAGRSGN